MIIQKNNDDFVVSGRTCVIAALPNSSDTVWFIRIKEPCIVETSEDEYGHAVVAGQSYIIGNFLEGSRSNSKGYYFKVDIKLPTFTMIVLRTLLHNSQKEK